MNPSPCSTISLSAWVEASAQLIGSSVGEHCWIAENTRFCYSTLGDYSYVSRNSNVFSTNIGKFTSISWNVSLGPANHDHRRISSHSMLFASRFGMIDREPLYNQYEGEVHIGHDVWIGCNSVIMRGVRVGDGAVIGANSIITKDVAPYTVVVGVDRVVKKRFEHEVVEALMELKWWDAPPRLLKRSITLLGKEPTLEVIAQLRQELRK